MNFQKISSSASNLVGSPYAFIAAFLFITVWAISGPFVGFSAAWQLTINTATTIITFLMVFLIQASQNNDTRAIHLKLDEILHSIEEASDEFIGAENMSNTERTKLAEKIEGVTTNGSERRP